MEKDGDGKACNGNNELDHHRHTHSYSGSNSIKTLGESECVSKMAKCDHQIW